MIGIVIVAHQPLGQALALAAQHVFGPIEQLAVVDALPDATPEQISAQTQAAIAQVNSGFGVLMLVDLIGATPSNAVRALAKPVINGLVAAPVNPPVEMVTGVNLPMLLRAVSYRQQPWPVLLEKVLQGASQCVVHIQSGEQAW